MDESKRSILESLVPESADMHCCLLMQGEDSLITELVEEGYLHAEPTTLPNGTPVQRYTLTSEGLRSLQSLFIPIS